MHFTKHSINGFTYLTAPNIMVKHAFTVRYGEASGGVFGKENCNVLGSALDVSLDSIVYARQVHGSRVQVVTENDRSDWFSRKPQEGDALITEAAGMALMVFTADCVPVLLCDPVRGAIGAVHAGWRGTVLGIAAMAVRKMESEFGCSPADIHAAIGPCISKCCYEVGGEVAEQFTIDNAQLTIDNAQCTIHNSQFTIGEDSHSIVRQAGDKYMVDLKKANRIMLENAGVKDIAVSNDCTFCSKDASHPNGKYWSHRKHGLNRGSQAAMIVRG